MQILRPPQLNMMALANRIQPMEGELLAAKLHRASVKSRMEKAFELHSVREIGSHCRGTAIRQFSDLDLAVVLRKDGADSHLAPGAVRAERMQWRRDLHPSTLSCVTCGISPLHASRFAALDKTEHSRSEGSPRPRSRTSDPTR
jgi:hypothetical protein